MTYKTSILKILFTDFAAFVCLIIPLLYGGMYLLLLSSGSPQKVVLFTPLYLGVVALVCWGIVLWRVYLIKTVVEDGWLTQATITNISITKDRGRIDYTYKYGENEYKSWCAVMLTQRTRSLRLGEQVPVMLDSSNHRRAFLPDLYLHEPVTPPALWQPSDPTGICVPFQGKYDRSMFLKSFMLVYRPTKAMIWWRIVPILLAVTAVVVIIAFESSQTLAKENSSSFVRVVIIVLGLLAGLLEPAIVAYYNARKAWKNVAHAPFLTGEADWQGIHYTRRAGKAEFIPWSKIVRGRVNRQMLALVSADGALHVLPRNFFPSEQEWAMAVLLANDNVRQSPNA